MDLRNLPEGTEASKRISERRRRIEKELGADLNLLTIDAPRIESADERNCEQMFGAVPVPVGLAGPLLIHFSSGESVHVYLPLATTEGALVETAGAHSQAPAAKEPPPASEPAPEPVDEVRRAAA